MIIGPEQMREIIAHAEEAYTDECVGFLIGDKGGQDPDEVYRCANIQNELHAADPLSYPRDARTAYNLGPRDLLLLSKCERAARPVQVIYHSHVDADAYFSAEDRRWAVMDGTLVYPVQYLVVSIYEGKARGANLFRWSARAQEFEESPVSLEGGTR